MGVAGVVVVVEEEVCESGYYDCYPQDMMSQVKKVMEDGGKNSFLSEETENLQNRRVVIRYLQVIPMDKKTYGQF